MSIYMAQGICVGLKDEIVEFTKDGKAQSFQSLSVAINSFDLMGEPVTIGITEDQKARFKPLQSYRFPIEISAYLSKGGAAVSQIRIPKNAPIEQINPTNPAANQSTPPAGK